MQVIVVGGGVAGTTSAIALRRIGADVTVYEAYADPAGTVGSFVSLATNGLKALDVLGCGDAVRAAGFAVERQLLRSGSGKVLGAMPRGRMPEEPMRSVTVMRGDLVAALRAEAVEAGARVVTGERLVGAVHDGGRVRAEFASGLTDEADLLVGADGIWSATRRVLDASAPEPAYAGLYTVSGVARGVEAAPDTFTMTFGRNGAFATVRTPGGDVWWAAQVASPEEPDLAAVDLDLLRDLYRHDDEPSAVLRAATGPGHATLMHSLGEVRVWHDDRIVLVGDASHPVGAGQGASMAVEDAVVLARSLEGAGDVPSALAAFDAARRPRITKMLRSSKDNRDAKTAGPLTRRIRDLVMPVMVRIFYVRATAWLFTYDVAAGGEPGKARQAAGSGA